MREILDQRRNLASRDPDEASATLRSQEYDLQVAPRDKGTFDFVSNVAHMPKSYVGFVRYGPAAQVRVPGARKRDDFFIHLPAKGRCETENRAGRFVCRRGQGVISSPAGHVMRSEPGSSRITLSFTKSALIEQLTVLLGDQPVGPLEFAPVIDLESPNGRRFARQVRLLLTDLDDADVGHNAILHATYEQLIMTGLLLGHHNTFTESFGRLERRAAPFSIKKAIEYIQDRLDTPIILADIVAASGVPGRTLLRQFRDYRGTSPMRYLRDERLARIRGNLLRGEVSDSVTDAATTWGVQHLGRFAVEYRRHFGESPSETHKRARARLKGAKLVKPGEHGD